MPQFIRQLSCCAAIAIVLGGCAIAAPGVRDRHLATASNLTIAAKDDTPNLDGDSQPNRTKFSECLADVQEVTGGWSEADMKAAAAKICQLRREHAQAKAKFIAELKKLTEQYQDQTNHGFAEHLPKAKSDAWTSVAACIDFKAGFTYPHNVAIYMVPEAIRKDCYGLGSQLVKSQLQ